MVAAYVQVGDLDAVRSSCKQQFEDLLKGMDVRSLLLSGFIPDAFDRADYARLLEHLRPLATARRLADTSLPNIYGALLYRAGQYERATASLGRAITGNSGNYLAIHARAFQAMTLHHLKRGNAADEWNRAQAFARRTMTSLPWHERALIEHLLKEAERELTLPVK